MIFESRPEIYVTANLYVPNGRKGPFPTVLHASERGKYDAVEETGEIVQLVRKGFAVFSVDLRGLGFSIPRLPAAGPVFYHGDKMQEDYAWASFTLGRPVLGQRVWDCLRCIDYLESRPDVDHGKIRGFGAQGAAIAMLAAAVMDGRLNSLMLDSIVVTYRTVVESKSYQLGLTWFLYGILKYFDLPDLLGALAPRPCWLLNATNGQGEPVPQSGLSAIYHHALDVYKQNNRREGLKLLVQPDDKRQNVLDNWLKAV